MMKFCTKEATRTRVRPTRQNARSRTPEATELEPPTAISLDDLRALIPEAVASNSSLHEVLSSSVESLTPPPEIDLDDLRDLLEPAGVLTRKDIEFKSKDLLLPSQSQEGTRFKIWQNVIEEPSNARSQSLDIPEFDKVSKGKLENSKSFEELKSKRNVSVRVKVVGKPEDADFKLEGPEEFIKKLQTLAEGDNLEQWIANLNLPKEFDLPQIREQIRVFLKDKCWEKDGGLRYKIMDGSIAKRLWTWFKDLSIAKQILVVIGLTLIAAAVGFLTIQFLAFVWPGVLGVGTPGEAALAEIGIEAFKTRQEPAFHMLHLHAEQAKPMSYAWANQYILWKYCRAR